MPRFCLEEKKGVIEMPPGRRAAKGMRQRRAHRRGAAPSGPGGPRKKLAATRWRGLSSGLSRAR